MGGDGRVQEHQDSI